MTQRIGRTIGLALLVGWACILTWGLGTTVQANNAACAPTALADVSSPPPTPVIRDATLSEDDARIDVTIDLTGYTDHTDKLKFKIALTRSLAVALEPILAKKQRDNTPDERHEDVIGVEIDYENVKKLDDNIGKIAVTLPQPDESDDNEADETPDVRPAQGARYYVLASAFYCDFETRMPDGALMRSAWGVFADNGAPLSVTTSPALHREALQGAFFRITKTQALRYIRVADVQANNSQLIIGDQPAISLENPPADVPVASSVEHAVELMRNRTNAVGGLMIEEPAHGGGVVYHHFAVVDVDEVAPNNVTVTVRSNGVNEKRELLLYTTQNLPFRSLVGALLDHYAFDTGVEDPIVGGAKADPQPWEEKNVRLLSGAILLLTAPLLEDYSTPEDLENNVTGGYLYLAQALVSNWDELGKVTGYDALAHIAEIIRTGNGSGKLRSLLSLVNSGPISSGDQNIKAVFVDGYVRVMLRVDETGVSGDPVGGVGVEVNTPTGIEAYSWEKDADAFSSLLDGTVGNSLVLRSATEVYQNMLSDEGGLWIKAGRHLPLETEDMPFTISARAVGLLTGATGDAKNTASFVHNPAECIAISDVRGLIDLKVIEEGRVSYDKPEFGHYLLVGQHRRISYNQEYKADESSLNVSVFGDNADKIVLVEGGGSYTIEATGVTGFEGAGIMIKEKMPGGAPLRVFFKHISGFEFGPIDVGAVVNTGDVTSLYEFELFSAPDLPDEVLEWARVIVLVDRNITLYDASQNEIVGGEAFLQEGQTGQITTYSYSWREYVNTFLTPSPKAYIELDKGNSGILQFVFLPSAANQDEFLSNRQAHESYLFTVNPWDDIEVSVKQRQFVVNSFLGRLSNESFIPPSDDSKIQWNVTNFNSLVDFPFSNPYMTRTKDGSVEIPVAVGEKSGAGYVFNAEVEELWENEKLLDGVDLFARSGRISVVSGFPHEIGDITSQGPQLFADGVSEVEVVASDIVDEYGNAVEDGTRVHWSLAGEALFVHEDLETVDGEARAIVRAGTTPGDLEVGALVEFAAARVSLEVKSVYVEISTEQNTLDISDKNNSLQVEARAIREGGEPAAGALVHFFSAGGTLVTTAVTDETGTATATLTAQNALVGHGRISAMLGQSVATKKVRFIKPGLSVEIQRPIIADDDSENPKCPGEITLPGNGRSGTVMVEDFDGDVTTAQELDYYSYSKVRVYGPINSEVSVGSGDGVCLRFQSPEFSSVPVDPSCHIRVVLPGGENQVTLDNPDPQRPGYGYAELCVETVGNMPDIYRRNGASYGKVFKQAISFTSGSGDFAVAEMGLLPPTLQARIEQLAASASLGFLTGGMNDSRSSLAGDFAARVLIWGDIRELVRESSRLVRGHDVDWANMSTSFAGLLLEAGPVVLDGVDAFVSKVGVLLRLLPDGPLRKFVFDLIPGVTRALREGGTAAAKQFMEQHARFVDDLFLNPGKIEKLLDVFSSDKEVQQFARLFTKADDLAGGAKFTSRLHDIASSARFGPDVARKTLGYLDQIEDADVFRKIVTNQKAWDASRDLLGAIPPSAARNARGVASDNLASSMLLK